MSNKKIITINTQFEFLPKGCIIQTVAKKLDKGNKAELKYYFKGINTCFGYSVVKLNEFTEQSVFNATRFFVEDDLKEVMTNINTLSKLFGMPIKN